MAWKISGSTQREPAPSCESAVADQPPISRGERLHIYEHAYINRLIENLEDDFKAVSRVIGEERFAGVVTDYMSHFPSTSPSVADLGRNFPAFLLLHEISADFPFLFELATFEWGLCEALYSANSERDRAPATQGEIPEAVWLQARIEIDKSLRAYKFEFPIPEIWKNGTPPERPVTTYAIVFRNEHLARFENLTESQFRLLRMLQSGVSIESALEQAGFSDPNELNVTFRDWMRWGILAHFDFSVPGCD